MDRATRKAVLGLFSYGLYCVTAKNGTDVSAMTANWLMQSSFEPPMITLAVEENSHTRRIIEDSGAFVVNVYGSDQRELAGGLGRSWARHPEKITEVAWQPAPVTGAPILESALAWAECRVVGSRTSGDHILFVAEIVEAGLIREGTPLTLRDAGFKYQG